MANPLVTVSSVILSIDCVEALSLLNDEDEKDVFVDGDITDENKDESVLWAIHTRSGSKFNFRTTDETLQQFKRTWRTAVDEARDRDRIIRTSHPAPAAKSVQSSQNVQPAPRTVQPAPRTVQPAPRTESEPFFNGQIMTIGREMTPEEANANRGRNRKAKQPPPKLGQMPTNLGKAPPPRVPSSSALGRKTGSKFGITTPVPNVKPVEVNKQGMIDMSNAREVSADELEAMNAKRWRRR